MKLRLLIALGAVFALLGIIPGGAQAAPKETDGGPSIVILRDGVAPEGKMAEHGVSSPKHVYKNALDGFAADLDPATASELAADPDVVMVVDDKKRSFHAESFNPVRIEGIGNNIWAQTIETVMAPAVTSGATQIESLVPQVAARGLRRIGTLSSPTAKIDGIDQRVNADIAVIDSGVQPDQPDLNVVGGCDCTGNNDYADFDGHGTMVAGVLGAKDNAFGLVGVAPGARIWSVRVLDETGYGDDSTVLCGLEWVTAHAGTIDVANMSIVDVGSDDGHCGVENGDAVHYALCQSVKKGVVYVAAAGNEGVDAKDNIPAAYREVITASAMVDSDGLPGGLGAPDLCEGFADDSFAPFSNFGRAIDIAAPGVCIATTYIGSDAAVSSGTSFAAPYVSGAAALYLASDKGKRELRHVPPWKRAAAVREKLIDQREKTKLPGDPDHRNEGVLNVSRL